ncbi:MAG: hypothetical protein IKP86_07950 [Anaerolineaceae bacterium]|nr:hypothetical protein [Anaerolineaceae bacterium]
MKRFLLCLLLSIFIPMFIIHQIEAVPSLQESTERPGDIDIEGLISDLSNLFSSEIKPTGEIIPGETAIPTPTIPEPTLPSEPTAEPEADPGELPGNMTEFKTAPDDPVSVSEPTGIEVHEFYDTFKTNVKNLGLHSVSFAEKGKKNASKANVDENITIYLYYDKKTGENILEHIVFEAAVTDIEEKEETQSIFRALISTLCTYFDTEYDKDTNDMIFAVLWNNGSVVYKDLLLYGQTESDKKGSEFSVKIYYTGGGYVEQETTSYSFNAEINFRDQVAYLQKQGVIPETDGVYRFHENYEEEWAQINWYQWTPFDSAANFVISSKIKWSSGSGTPNYDSSGCGFVFRNTNNLENYLYASLNMDGMLHIGGNRGWNSLMYKPQKYGTYSTKGEAELVIAAYNDRLYVYVNGAPIAQIRDIPLTESGDLAFVIMSGTNKDYGIRCTFSDIYYYIW